MDYIEHIDEAPAPSPYVYRVADVPPARARAIFDALIVSGALRDEPVELLGTGCPDSSRPGTYSPLRCIDARLRVGPRRMRVELQLLPWSRSRTELSIRPARSSARVNEAYYRVARDLLDRLAFEIEVEGSRATDRGADARAA